MLCILAIITTGNGKKGMRAERKAHSDEKPSSNSSFADFWPCGNFVVFFFNQPNFQ
jgi:hypothetical protein